MAKLNVTIPAVEVEIEGVKYRKVDRKAAVGDVLKITDNDDCDYVIDGAFYEVSRLDSCDDPQFIDEDGDEFDGANVEYEVYEKVAVQYREVKRPAKVGERIKIVNADDLRYENGEEFTVDSTAAGGVLVKHPRGNNRGRAAVLHKEYVVLEPIEESAQPAKPKRLTVGDYAKVVADSAGTAKIGAIVKITRDDGSIIPYMAEYANGNKVGVWLRESEIEPATEAEFLAQSRFKVGDYVKVVDADGAKSIAEVGDIGEVINDNWGGGSFGSNTIIDVKTLDGRKYGMFVHRFVRATEAEVAAAQREAKDVLKYGDFADGDFAQVVNATADNATISIRHNGGKFGKVTREIGGWCSLKITFADGDFGFCNPDALRKVTREVYVAAVDPRNQFARGDKVRLISGGGSGGLYGFYDGNIYTIGRTTGEPGGWEGRVEIYGGEAPAGYAKPEQLEKVSAEEIAEIEKWAAIGRKVGEFKRGDVVKVVRVPNGVTNGHEDGAIGEVVSYTIVVDNRNGNPPIKVSGVPYPYRNNAVIIVPVEQRFDREEKAAA